MRQQLSLLTSEYHAITCLCTLVFIFHIQVIMSGSYMSTMVGGLWFQTDQSLYTSMITDNGHHVSCDEKQSLINILIVSHFLRWQACKGSLTWYSIIKGIFCFSNEIFLNARNKPWIRMKSIYNLITGINQWGWQYFACLGGLPSYKQLWDKELKRVPFYMLYP